ncbi:ATP-binding cassette sub-family A member 3-like, partial [Scaptodrosophila lebanonensis]|uniref:ATP-binding cassette sub-family A member 3-like n=1 Tax=Drosophila lebanonensis TaxID=7225 RepID=A0A6J2UBX0_DROLE
NNQIKVTLAIMGVPVWLHWLGWFIKWLLLLAKIMECLLLNSGMGWAFVTVADFEGSRNNLGIGTLFTPIKGSLSVGTVMVLMLLGCLINMILCLYFEQIRPGNIGITRKWNFPFTRTFWCPRREPGADKNGDWDEEKGADTRRESIENNFEAEPKGKSMVVQAQHLTKSFDGIKVVKNFSLNLYEDELTVLLGHNGAGKTTTIMMLTGVYKPTSGRVIINGYDMATAPEKARNSLSICPQYNVLFDDLTVEQHIRFFCTIKGLKKNEINEEIQKYVLLLGLTSKAQVRSRKLSGGMKRKLSICCALCGNTRVVFCDEPSTGLDPSARHDLWSILQNEKTGRCILLTTHYMDEAEVLADRVAIMGDGELRGYGTAFFMQQNISAGYQLICVQMEDCDVDKVTTFLKRYIPKITLEHTVGTDLIYRLPVQETSKFEKMFKDLENNLEDLRLHGFGLNPSTLADAFMKIGTTKTKFLPDEEDSRKATAWGSQTGECRCKSWAFPEKDSNLFKAIPEIINITAVSYAVVPISNKRICEFSLKGTFRVSDKGRHKERGAIIFEIAYSVREKYPIFDTILIIFPMYALADGLKIILYNIEKVESKQCEGDPEGCKDALKSIMTWRPTHFLIIEALLYFALLMLLSVYSRRLRYCLRKLNHRRWPKLVDNEEKDKDVLKEEQRVSEMTEEDIEAQNLVLDHAVKAYKKLIAVREISLAVKPYECFGLLGLNGAGKTSTFNMIVGEQLIDSGNIFIKGISVKSNACKALKHVGYCPQNNTYWNFLTGRESLHIIFQLHRVKKADVNDLVEQVAKYFQFQEHLDKMVRNYSGGTKRKFTSALCALGPTLMCLDEPTTGIDPAATRDIWGVLTRMRDSGKSLMLTSHSMEECEALCSRLAIMVNGQFCCLGSLQHIKSRFSMGMVIQIKVCAKDELDRAKANMKRESQAQSDIEKRKSASRSSATTPIQSEEEATTRNTISSSTSGENKDDEQRTKRDKKVEEKKRRGSASPTQPDKKVDKTDRPSTSQETVKSNRTEGDSDNLEALIDKVVESLTEKFPDIKVVEQNGYRGMVTMHLPNKDVKWSEIFGYLEKKREKLQIFSYSICQTSLQEIFIKFANDQK